MMNVRQIFFELRGGNVNFGKFFPPFMAYTTTKIKAPDFDCRAAIKLTAIITVWHETSPEFLQLRAYERGQA